MPTRHLCLRLPLAVVAFCGLLGCTRHEYHIDMEPDGSAVKRTTRIKYHRESDADAPPDKTKKNTAFRDAVAQLAKAYGQQPPAFTGTEFDASGRFTTRLPDDVGGSGRFVRWESNLGSVVAYAERFRGNDDLYGALQDMSASVDQVVDLVIGWLEREARGEAGWTEVRAFLDGSFRRDLHNLALLSWSLNFLRAEPPKVVVRDRDIRAAPSHRPTEPQKTGVREPAIGEQSQSDTESQVAAEIAMRGILYLSERGYFAVEDAPTIARAMQSGKRDRLMPLVRKSLASRLRPIAPKFDVEKLAFLQAPETVVESWQPYFIGTDYFRKRRDEVRAAMIGKIQGGNGHTYSDRDVATQVVTDLFIKAFASPLGNAFKDFDELQLSLRAPRAPWWTNGRWMKDQKTIEWKRKLSLTTAFGQFPTFCFAIWSEPDTESQSRLFGRTAVDDHRLIDYCLWHSGLTAGERKEWDDFVKTLTNEPKSQQKLTAFRFSHEPITIPTGDRVAAPAIKILKDELPGERD